MKAKQQQKTFDFFIVKGTDKAILVSWAPVQA